MAIVLVFVLCLFSQSLFANYIRSNNIDRMRHDGGDLYVFTAAGFSVIEGAHSSTDFILSHDYPFNYSDVRSITVYDGRIYFSLRTTTDTGFNDRIVVVSNTGETIREIPTVWGHPPNDFFRDILIRSDTIVAARWLAGLHFFDSQNWYFSPIDSVASTPSLLGEGDFFEAENFRQHLESRPWNAVEGISFIDGYYIARTFNGLYRSRTLEGPWNQVLDTTLQAKRPLAIQTGEVNGRRVYYFWFTTGQQAPWDNKFQGEDIRPGFYYSLDTLRTFMFDERVSRLAVRSISAYGSRILFLSSDSLFIGEIDVSGAINWVPVNRDEFLTNQLRAATLVSRESIFISTEDKGVIYRHSDNLPWRYLLVPKDVRPGLSEVYAYPTILRPGGGNAIFAYSLLEDDIVSIKVFDWNGDLVRTVIDRQQRFGAMGGGSSTDIANDFWDGRDNSGRMATPGTYFFKIFAHNQKKEAFGKVIVARGEN